MKKIIIAVVAVVLWLAAVIGYTVAGTASDGDDGEHDFIVLTVKEETVKDYNTMPVFTELARMTGKDVYWTYNTSNQYSNNIDPISIKGIDAIYHAGFSNLKLYNYGRRGKIVAIDEYLDSMPNFKRILENPLRQDIRQALESPDGHIYSLPRIEEMGLKAYPNILFLNKEWVKQLIDKDDLPASVNLQEEDLKDGLKLKRSEFKAILQKFCDTDISGVDSKNKVPLAFVSGNWQGNESDLIASFGVPENREHKTVENGKITFTIENENWFNAIAEMNDWYNRGLIRSSAFSQTQDEFLAKGQDGRYGAFYWWEKETVVAKDKQNDYIVLQPLVDDVTGKQYAGVSNEQEIEKSECVILSSCKDIKGLLGYFDKFFEPEISAQLNYGSIASGAFKSQKDENGKLVPNDDHGNQSTDDFRMKNAPYGVVYLTAEEWENNIEMEPRAKLRLERLEKWVKAHTFENVKPIPNLNYTKEQLDVLNMYESSLGNNISAWMTNSITAPTKPSKSDWLNNLLKTNRKSIDEVKRVNQEAYDSYLSKISAGS